MLDSHCQLIWASKNSSSTPAKPVLILPSQGTVSAGEKLFRKRKNKRVSVAQGKCQLSMGALVVQVDSKSLAGSGIYTFEIAKKRIIRGFCIEPVG